MTMTEHNDDVPTVPEIPPLPEPRGPHPDDAALLEQLDGYGHMSYTVGNEDWVACGDFNVVNDPERGLLIAYHVVVDCESAGFVDTPEAAVVPAQVLPPDWCPLWSYADSCSEMYVDSDEYPPPDADEVGETCERWVTAVQAALRAEG
jgi:hypothetical protein